MTKLKELNIDIKPLEHVTDRWANGYFDVYLNKINEFNTYITIHNTVISCGVKLLTQVENLIKLCKYTECSPVEVINYILERIDCKYKIFDGEYTVLVPNIILSTNILEHRDYDENYKRLDENSIFTELKENPNSGNNIKTWIINLKKTK